MILKGRKMKKSNKSRERIGLGVELFWDRIGQKSVEHVGRGDQLKGTVHEFAYCEKKNIVSIFKGYSETCVLTAKKNATVVDAVTMSRGKVISRVQLKDVISASGVKAVQKRVNSGYYRSAKIVATYESAKKLARNSNKKIYSSGISSKTTNRVADNQGVNVRSKDILKTNVQDIGAQAASAALFSTALATVSETVNHYHAYKKGTICAKEYGKRVVKHAGKQAMTSGAKTASALMIKEGIKQTAKVSGKTALKRVASSNVVTTVVFGIVEQSVDTFSYMNGNIDKKAYKKRSVQNAGSTGGAAAGAALGASIGSIVPGAGTAIGAVIGGIAGSLSGSWGAGKLVSR